jgi:HEPN domain-containing protein
MADQQDLANELLTLATDDLAAAEALVDVPGVTDAIVGFHAQQAAEKALKAVLAARSQDFPRTHNLSLLLQLCDDAGWSLPARLEQLDLLTPYGVAARYGMRMPGAVDRGTATQLARPPRCRRGRARQSTRERGSPAVAAQFVDGADDVGAHESPVSAELQRGQQAAAGVVLDGRFAHQQQVQRGAQSTARHPVGRRSSSPSAPPPTAGRLAIRLLWDGGGVVSIAVAEVTGRVGSTARGSHTNGDVSHQGGER